MKLSVVTTLYKSSSHIDNFYKRISLECQKITEDYEIIFVDDGSPDDSLIKSIELCKKDNKLKIIELSRNFGHHKAMITGLSHAIGQYIFLVDSDLEEEPELLGFFWEALNSNRDVDVVSAKQTTKRKTSFTSDILSQIFYKVFNFFSEVNLPENEFVARLMTEKFVNSLLQHKEVNLFLPGIWHLTGFKIKYLSFEKKHINTSSYTFTKKVQLSIDAITSFSAKPLYFVFFGGFFIFAISIIIIAYLVLEKIMHPEVTIGWTSLIASIWAMGGIIMLAIGIVGIYLGKVMNEVKNRPLTLIKNIHTGNLDD